MSLTIDVIEINEEINEYPPASMRKSNDRVLSRKRTKKGCSRKRAKRRDGKHIEIYNSRKEERATTLREISISVFKMLHGTPS